MDWFIIQSCFSLSRRFYSSVKDKLKTLGACWIRHEGMLGGQVWFVALALPTVVAGSFIATRKRLAYQWRDELMDPNGAVYSSATDYEMSFLQRMASSTQSHSKAVLEPKDNMGWYVTVDRVVAKMYSAVCLNEIRDVASAYGVPLDSSKECHLNTGEKVDWSDNVVLSDHPEDSTPIRAPWGCGDKLNQMELPLVLRFLSKSIQTVYPDVGRLRHIYVDYSPSGSFYRYPKSPKPFDGHDYVILPLRRDRQDTVITFSPLSRSKVSDLSDVAKSSWTTQDIDTRLPNGSMLRVYGAARYNFGWGLRPGTPWWGSPSQLVRYATESNSAYKRLKSLLLHDNRNAISDAAVLVFHYEGPRAKGKRRSLLFHPECFIFGRAPSTEDYDQWHDVPPTEESIRKQGVIPFLAKNYLTMFRVS